MTAPLTIRLASEFGCWPLWDHDTGENLDPAGLRLPPALADRIVRWDEAFQATFDSAYPPDSRFPDGAAEVAWRAEGNAIFDALREVLGPDRVRRRERL